MSRIRAPLSIEIYRNAYYIKNYTPKRCYTLEKCLSVFDYIGRKYTHRGFYYDEDNKILKIPSHLDINFILDKCASDEEFITDIKDYRNKFVKSRHINKIICKAKPKNDIQREAVDFIVANNAADKYKSHRLVCLSTGFGKTVCSIIGSLILKMPTVIISVNLSKQWIDRLLMFTNGELGKDIIHIKTWNDIDKLMEMKYPPMGSFYIIGLDAANAALKKDVTKLNTFYEKFGIGIQILDEFHLHFIKVLNVLVNTSVERVLYLSATPTRSEKFQSILFKKLFTANIPSFGEHTHHINKYNILSVTYKTYPKIQEISNIETKRGVNGVNYFKYLFKDINKYSMVVDIILHFTRKILQKYPDKKIIIYIQSLNGIKIIKNILTEVFKNNESNYSIGDYSGNVEKSVRHLELEKNIIFSTLANGTGLDVKDLIMLINFIPFSSQLILRQIRGRLREEVSWYVDVTDTGFEGMIRQQNIRILDHKRNMKSIKYFEYNPNNRKVEKIF